MNSFRFILLKFYFSIRIYNRNLSYNESNTLTAAASVGRGLPGHRPSPSPRAKTWEKKVYQRPLLV
jgi:hypothetical protein